ncbi:hypothetical protein Asulf_00133 [Archaeoglobus sulfaticallidus PM70-1]|uniref:Cytochrome C biogenesis protein transmembrane domain-containing protein n=1 Tax=Archaeoglobus sulfaticallidus PM70-1 TaxID=387631 RepID=N0B973_9EURY|nr:cytochrome c biogenesis protein CcdA [Archaeoglobus sulfaticallidus]AGK60169.1 hypothetical protein Asulf_00133 [Archaeoglobus sulfaticallidus PM70-1]
MIEYPIAFIGGLISALSPCVLPVIPVVFAVSRANIVRAFVTALSMTATFSILGFFFGLIEGQLRVISSLILAIFGAMLLLNINPFQSLPLGITNRIYLTGGVVGSILLGAGLGVIWSPCIGPILGAVLSLASSSSGLTVMLAYSSGFGMAIASILFLGLKATERVVRVSKASNRIFGAIILVFVVLVVTGYLAEIELIVAEKMGFVEDLLVKLFIIKVE